MLSHLGLPRLKGNFAGDDKTLLLEIGSTIVTVLFVDAPLPKDAWERPIVLDKVWPKAKDAMAIQRVHVIISNLNSVLDHNAAL